MKSTENKWRILISRFSVHFSHSVISDCNPMDCSTPGFSLQDQHPGPAQTHVHWRSDVIHPYHTLSSLSLPKFNLSWHQGLFQRVSFLHQVAKVLELQLQHQSFQSIFRIDFTSDWLVWSPCKPRNSQESSPTPQFKSIILIIYLLMGFIQYRIFIMVNPVVSWGHSGLGYNFHEN